MPHMSLRCHLTTGPFVFTKSLHGASFINRSKKNISVVTKFRIFANSRPFLEIHSIFKSLENCLMEIYSIVFNSIFFRYSQQQDPAGSFCSVMMVNILWTHFERHCSRTFLFPRSQALHTLVLPSFPSFLPSPTPHILAALNSPLCTLLLDIAFLYNRWSSIYLKHRGTEAESLTSLNFPFLRVYLFFEAYFKSGIWFMLWPISALGFSSLEITFPLLYPFLPRIYYS